MDFRIQGVIDLQDRVSQGVRSASSSLNELNEVVLTQWWGLQNIAGAFTAVGAAATGAMALAAKEAMNWEESMADLNRTIQSVGDYEWEAAENLEAVESGLRRVARTSPVAASELANIATQAGQLGVARRDIEEFTKVVSEIAEVSTLSTEEAGFAFARLGSIFEISQDQFQNLGSAIVELGRGSASTENEITNFATRLAGTAKTAGMTAQSTLAIGSAMANVGIRAERGSTAMQRTIFQMMEAVGSGGEELQTFARVSGTSAEEFAEAWAREPAEAITLFVEGLDNINRAGGNADQVLEALGMNGVRQKEVLLALAGASQNMTNANTRLRNSLELSGSAFQEGAALAEIVEQRYKTFTAQLGMLRNQISEVAENFGSMLLPVMKAITSAMQLFLDGLMSVPPGVRVLMGAMVGFIGIVGTATGAIFAFLPRLVMMRHSLQTLAQGGAVAAGSLENLQAKQLRGVGTANTLTAATDRNTAAMHRNTGAARANQIAVQGVAIKHGTLAAAMSGTQMAAVRSSIGMAGATSAASRLANVAMFAGRALGIVGVALAALSIGTTIYGAITNRAKDETEDFAQANLALVDILQGQSGAIDQNVQRWVRDQLVMANAIPIAQQLGVEMATLTAIISGAASRSEMNQFEQQMDSAGEQGQKLLEIVKEIRRVFSASAEAAQATAVANDVAAESFEDLGDAADEAKKKIQEAAKAQDKRNQAMLQYGDAVFAQRRAQFALADAQREYNEALRNARNPTNVLRDAEWRVRDARWAVRDATLRAKDAERELKNARANERIRLQDAEWDLADARDRYADSLDNIIDREEALKELREGPTEEQLRDAILKIEKAQVRLMRAHQGVADAEWYLQYLREEGASNRDIEDAELNLAEARHELSDSEKDLADSTEELNDLRRGPDARELAKAERDLEKAYRDSEKAAKRIKDAEGEVRQIRRDIANDTAYREALRESQRVTYDLEKSQYNLEKAQRELNKTTKADLWRDVAKAQLGLEEAGYRLAQSNVEVQKQTAIMNGEFWDAGREAQALARELGNVGRGMPGAIRKNFDDVARVLRRAIPQLKEHLEGGMEDLASDITGPGGLGEGLANAIGGDLDYNLGEMADESASSWWDKIGNFFKKYGGTAGGAIGAGIGFAIGGPVGAVIGGLAGTVIGWLIGKFWDPVANFMTNRLGPWFADRWRSIFDNPDIVDFGSFMYQAREKLGEAFGNIFSGIGWFGAEAGRKLDEAFRNMGRGVAGWASNAWGWGRDVLAGLGRGISNAWTYVQDGFRNAWSRFTGWVKGLLGINSPSTVAMAWGGDVMRGLARGMINNVGSVLNFAASLPGRISGAIGNVASWTYSKGADVIGGMWSGLSSRWQGFRSEWLNPMGSYISSNIGNLFNATVNKGRDIVGGLWNGVYNKYQALKGNFQQLGSWISNAIGSTFNFGSPSKLMARWGEWIVEGLMRGISSEKRGLLKTMQDIMDIMIPEELPKLAQQYSPSVKPSLDTSGIQRVLGSVPAELQQRYSQHQGDSIQVQATSQADPFDIAEEIAWSKMVRERS